MLSPLSSVASSIASSATTGAASTQPAAAAAPAQPGSGGHGGEFSIRREQPTAAPEQVGATGPLSAATPARPATPAEAVSPAERPIATMLANERKLDRAIASARRGKTFSPEQLLALQADVAKYSMQVDVTSRVVDRVSAAVKQIMTTQV